MIKLNGDKVYLTETDFKSMNGIWGAFRSNPSYCGDLLKLGSDRYEEFSKIPETYNAKVDESIPVEKYVDLFNIVFIEKNYEVVNE